ncbi:uncharacterized protein BDR25DRAFT_396885 [Lindgomyces ingoldianus]|uniref:Uncharacterized protein n=1 Tax=Lindgomyces ingoldianus TaxID=673940 RepID=A0ACB6QAN8_9PLEO|nr:uncharacterized protein BDR25DRAFT_396885 [Lindgomyces ingoldianus]KAF2464099.1 hypothetical protein BDR25DRAFT_396885 [Lindgomyces ingoldianus]
MFFSPTKLRSRRSSRKGPRLLHHPLPNNLGSQLINSLYPQHLCKAFFLASCLSYYSHPSTNHLSKAHPRKASSTEAFQNGPQKSDLQATSSISHATISICPLLSSTRAQNRTNNLSLTRGQVRPRAIFLLTYPVVPPPCSSALSRACLQRQDICNAASLAGPREILRQTGRLRKCRFGTDEYSRSQQFGFDNGMDSQRIVGRSFAGKGLERCRLGSSELEGARGFGGVGAKVIWDIKFKVSWYFLVRMLCQNERLTAQHASRPVVPSNISYSRPSVPTRMDNFLSPSLLPRLSPTSISYNSIRNPLYAEGVAQCPHTRIPYPRRNFKVEMHLLREDSVRTPPATFLSRVKNYALFLKTPTTRLKRSPNILAYWLLRRVCSSLNTLLTCHILTRYTPTLGFSQSIYHSLSTNSFHNKTTIGLFILPPLLDPKPTFRPHLVEFSIKKSPPIAHMRHFTLIFQPQSHHTPQPHSTSYIKQVVCCFSTPSMYLTLALEKESKDTPQLYDRFSPPEPTCATMNLGFWLLRRVKSDLEGRVKPKCVCEAALRAESGAYEIAAITQYPTRTTLLDCNNRRTLEVCINPTCNRSKFTFSHCEEQRVVSWHLKTWLSDLNVSLFAWETSRNTPQMVSLEDNYVDLMMGKMKSWDNVAKDDLEELFGKRRTYVGIYAETSFKTPQIHRRGDV